MARHFAPLLQKGSGGFGAPNPGPIKFFLALFSLVILLLRPTLYVVCAYIEVF